MKESLEFYDNKEKGSFHRPHGELWKSPLGTGPPTSLWRPSQPIPGVRPGGSLARISPPQTPKPSGNTVSQPPTVVGGSAFKGQSDRLRPCTSY